MVKITPDELADVNPFDSSQDSWSTIEWIAAHYSAWRAVEVTETYGTSDMQLYMKASSELAGRGVTFHESFPYYSGIEINSK
jgi:hypothetical protein